MLPAARPAFFNGPFFSNQSDIKTHRKPVNLVRLRGAEDSPGTGTLYPLLPVQKMPAQKMYRHCIK